MFTLDIHNHIAVKTYLYDGSILDGDIRNGGFLRDIESSIFPNSEVNVVEFQTDLKKMKAGGVNGLISAHYVPESGLLSNLDSGYQFIVNKVVRTVLPNLYNRVEKNDWHQQSFDACMLSMDILEAKVASAVSAGENVVVPRDLHSFNAARETNATIILHSVEGAHHLGRQGNGVVFQSQINNLHTLSRRGVCLLTLAHFFDNDFVCPIQGMPPDVRNSVFSKHTWSQSNNDGARLQHEGRALVSEMFDIGMIVDLTHSGRAVRDEVYEINNARAHKRPIVFSHTGVQALFNNAQYASDGMLGVSDSDIDAIADCDGVIGIILYNYWLSGKEEVLGSRLDYGIQYVLDTVAYIKKRTGSYRNIAIGSDFDGMTDPPDDVPTIAYFSKIERALRNAGLLATELEEVLGANMLRVLENGWR